MSFDFAKGPCFEAIKPQGKSSLRGRIPSGQTRTATESTVEEPFRKTPGFRINDNIRLVGLKLQNEYEK